MHLMSAGMRLLLFLSLLNLTLLAGPLGTFQGELVGAPKAGYLYVKGKNGMLRRVQLGSARITYGAQVPANRRSSDPSSNLVPGAVVRVTAEEGADGEWHARAIVLLHLPAGQSSSRLAESMRHPALNSV